MADYIIVNPLQTELTNVNAGGDDIAPESMEIATLTDAEAAAVIVAGGALIPSGATYQERRQIARTMKYEKVAPN